MSDFEAKMHQIRFPLGLRPGPRWGSLRRSPGPLAVFKGAYWTFGDEPRHVDIRGWRYGPRRLRVNDDDDMERNGRGEGEGREWRGNDLTHHLSQIPGYATGCRRRLAKPRISMR